MGHREERVLARPFIPGFLPSSDIYCGRHCGFNYHHHDSLKEDKQQRGHYLTSYEALGQSISRKGLDG